MTSPDADDGRNGPRPFSLSPALFAALSPLPPDMSPITPATRSVAASVVHENHTPDNNHDEGIGHGKDDALDGTMHVDDASLLPNGKGRADAQQLGPASALNNLAGLAPLGLDTKTTTLLSQDALTAFSNDLGLYSQAPSMPILGSAQHNMSLMMALAQLSANQQLNQPPPRPPSVVNPAQVSLPNLPNLLHGNHDIDMQDDGQNHAEGSGSASAVAATPAPLESFAKIEFADSVFQMTTYAVIIGRDQKALEQARRDERRAEEYQRRVEESAAAGLLPPSPPRQGNLVRFSKSYVSEEGGMLGPESDGDGEQRPAKRRKHDVNGSNSNNSQQQPQQQEQGGLRPEEDAEDKDKGKEKDKDLIINRQYVSHTPGAAAVDLASLRSSPNHVPFIGIHSPGPKIAAKTKAISREHLKIQYNPKTGVFEAIPLHKNGFFREEVHYREEPAILRSGDRIQIKDVEFAFIINGVGKGKTGAEEYEEHKKNRRYSEGGKEMSFDFESSHAGEILGTSSDEEEEEGKLADVAQPESDSDLSDADADGDADHGEDMMLPDVDDHNVMPTIEHDMSALTHHHDLAPLELLRQETERTEMSSSEMRQDEPRSSEMAQDIKPEAHQLHLLNYAEYGDMPPMPPKKRGPGRPPKNGIMSKREERLRKKQAMELAKKTMPQPPPGEPPIKRKVGRPRKHPRPEDDPERPEKRKYKPRKPKGENGEEISDGERPMKEKRREKPKTPPLELRKEDFTEEQLQKPNKNYGVLIDEVLTEAAGDGLTLKQIYKRIQRKYPYYYFVVDTKGWESSVRHNLIGNDAFKKNEETHLWSRVPGIELDAGKKRKAPSPDQATAQLHHGYGQQQHYQQQMPHPGMYQQQHMVQQGYQPNAMAPQGYPPNNNQHMQPQPQQPQQLQQQQQLPPQQYQQPLPAGNPPQQQPNGLQPPAMPIQQQQQPQQQLPQAQRPVFQAQVPAPTPAQLPGYGQQAVNRPMQLGAQGQTTTYSSPYASTPPPAPTPPTNGLVPTPTPPVQATQAPQQQPGQLGQPQQQAYPQQAQQQSQLSGQPALAPIQYNPQQQPQQYAQQPQRPYQPQGQVPGQAQVPMPAQQPMPQAQAPAMQPAQNQPPRPPVQPGQPAPPTQPPLPLEPAVSPAIIHFINNFKKNVLEHISSKTDHGELVTLSVINRGLGLTDVSMAPDEASIEKVVLDVFVSTKQRAYPTGALHPGLVTVLKAFKAKWVEILGTKLGQNKAEVLLLSAIDRFLGLSERTILTGSEKEKREYEQAEDMLIPQLKVEVTAYQNRVANGGAK